MIRYGKDGIYRVRPPGGLVAARFRHYEARSGRPLLFLGQFRPVS
ncbi:hypothetical protein [Streptomyces sp. NPDC031705]